MTHKGAPFEPRRCLMNTIMNNLTNFLLGKMFTLDEPLFKKFIEIEQMGMEVFSFIGKHAVIDVFPWLRFFGNKTPECIDIFEKKAHDLYNEMKRVFVPAKTGGYTPMLEDFLGLLEEGKVVGGDERVEKACTNLIFAGAGTSTSSMHALFNVLTHYNDVQKKLQVCINFLS